jgi:predicted AAA+ superfamily ATPase
MVAHDHAQTWNSAELARALGVSQPTVGASWEGFVIEQLLARPEVSDPWFWATHAGAEIDLVVTAGGQRVGVEDKRTDRPSSFLSRASMTPSTGNEPRDLRAPTTTMLTGWLSQ